MIENGIRAVGTVCVCLVANPRFTVVLPALCLVFWRIHSFTKTGFLEVDRLRESLYSPIMSHFGESLRGCVTIRAFKATNRFTLQSHDRMDKKEAAVWAEEHMRMWLDVRMQCGVATPLIALSALLAILGQSASSNFSVAAAGLAIQYAGRITDELISVVENFTWVGAQCVGIEKVCEYIDLPPEEPRAVVSNAQKEHELAIPPPEWPDNGHIVLRDITLTYRPGLEPALKGITATINAGEHIGIVGRTGAGKSSLTLAILRLADQVTGRCEIDGVETGSIPLMVLRQRIAIIPQEATSKLSLSTIIMLATSTLCSDVVNGTVFAGDIRHNLDPLGTHTDDVLTRALEEVSLADVVKDAVRTHVIYISKIREELSHRRGSSGRPGRYGIRRRCKLFARPTAAVWCSSSSPEEERRGNVGRSHCFVRCCDGRKHPSCHPEGIPRLHCAHNCTQTEHSR